MSERQNDGASAAVIDRFCAALVGEQPLAAKAFADRLLDCGVGIDALYDNYLPRAAGRLGDMWLDDTLGFAAVTLGMARLTEVFRSLSPLFMKTRRPVSRGRRALFALVPGEEHAFGVVLAADHFQRAGWMVQVELRAPLARLETLAAEQPFDLVGLSAGSRRMLPALEHCLGRLRAAAGPRTRFALGGALVRMEPGLPERLGAEIDGCAVREAIHDLDGTL